jgi:hypothetical protein
MRRRRWRTGSRRRGIRLLRARVIGRRRLAYKIDRLARQRAVDEGLLLVPGYSITSSRILRNMKVTSTPGVSILCKSAAVNGLLRPLPSSAVVPSRAA